MELSTGTSVYWVANILSSGGKRRLTSTVCVLTMFASTDAVTLGEDDVIRQHKTTGKDLIATMWQKMERWTKDTVYDGAAATLPLSAHQA